MDEGDFGGVECLARSAAGVGAGLFAGSVRVGLLAAEHVADLGEMNADLMGAPRFQAAFDDRVIAKLFHRPDVSNRAQRTLSRFAERRTASQPIAAVADQP